MNKGSKLYNELLIGFLSATGPARGFGFDEVAAGIEIGPAFIGSGLVSVLIGSGLLIWGKGLSFFLNKADES